MKHRITLLSVALAALAGLGLTCGGEEYTILVDREDGMYVLAGTFSGVRAELERNDAIKLTFAVLDSGGPIDFLALSDADYAAWENEQQYQAVIEVGSSRGATRTAVIPEDGEYWFIASNRSDSTALRVVTYEIWRKDR